MARDSDPPGDDEGGATERPFGALGALGWTLFHLMVVMLALSVSASLRPGLSSELVNLQICFALGAAVTVYGIVRVHMPGRTLGDAVSLRPTHPLAILLAMALGVAMVLPLAWVEAFLEARYPPSAEEIESLAQVYSFHSTAHKAIFALIAIAIGPFFEEMFCRGALFRGLRLSQSSGVSIALSALAFAFLHVLSLRALPYALLAGFALGMLRDATGSVIAPLVAHAAFNAVDTFFELGPSARATSVTAMIHWPQALAGLFAVIVLVAMTYALGRRLPVLAAAREEDAR